MAFVPLLAIVLMIASSLSLPVILLVGVGKQVSKDFDSNTLGLLMIGRLLGFAAFVCGLAMVVDPSTRIDSGLKTIAARSAYFLDMQTNIDCSPIPGDHVTRISDEFVVVGRITEDGPRFSRQRCLLEASADPLPPPAAKPMKAQSRRP